MGERVEKSTLVVRLQKSDFTENFKMVFHIYCKNFKEFNVLSLEHRKEWEKILENKQTRYNKVVLPKFHKITISTNSTIIFLCSFK